MSALPPVDESLVSDDRQNLLDASLATGVPNSIGVPGDVDVLVQRFIAFGFDIDDQFIAGAIASGVFDATSDGNNNDGDDFDAAGVLDLGFLPPDTGSDPALFSNDPIFFHLIGDRGDNELIGASRSDTLEGGRGADTLNGLGGDDTIFGGRGGDFIEGGDGDDEILGEGGGDFIAGGDGDDDLFGGAGSDTIVGDDGDDEINGGAGRDTLEGGNGDDRIVGFDGNDTILGQRGDDVLSGNVGNDTIRGGGGDDVIEGGKGNDMLFGNGGDDVFVYFGKDDFGSDVIRGFKLADDHVDLTHINGLAEIDFFFLNNNRGLLNLVNESGDDIGSIEIRGGGLGNALDSSAAYDDNDAAIVQVESGVEINGVENMTFIV